MTPIKNVSPDTVDTWLRENKAILIDVREKAEYDCEHIKGSIFLPLSQFESRKIPMTPDKIIVFHCRSGARSQRACQAFLQDYDQFETYNLEGGILSWINAGLPVERGVEEV